jgi:hypothetical protein
MEIQIAWTSTGKKLQDLKDALESQPEIAASGAHLELRESKVKYRSIDPTLLVAIVGAAGTGLSALIAGLFQIRLQMAAKKFVLETHDGRKLEVPANTPPEQIDHLLEKLGQMGDVKKISVK